MNWQETPIYVTNRNNLDRGFKRLLTWLKEAEMTDVTVIDNASTFPPLLRFYEENPDIKVIRQSDNLGPYAFWTLKLNEQTKSRYIVTDPDVVPDKDCPKDLVRKMHEVFDRYTPCLKVGPGIRIDNIPDHYSQKEKVLNHEYQFSSESERMPEGDCFCALIDTTFAMYIAGDRFPDWCSQFRLASPYVVEHIPWYEDSSNLKPEEIFYKESVEKGWSTWR